MIKKIQRDFLLLFQCIIDYGADVLRDFTMKKIKKKYNCDDFTVFLKDEKHCFYHQWEKNKTACCECPAHGCTLPKTGKVENTLFNKLYFFDNAIKWPKGHGKWNDSVITQKCICRYIASAITIEELDLSDLYTTLINTRIITMITNYERSLLKQIMTVRGSVCHAIKTTKFSETELTQLWEAFTDTLYKLFPGDPKWVKKGIEQLKTKILSEEDVQELMSKIGITLTEVQDISDTIINVLGIQTNAIKHCVAAEGTSIKTCINESIKPITGQLNQHSELLPDLKKRQQKTEDKLNAVIGMMGKQYIRAEVYPEQLVQLQETSEASDSQKIKISIKLDLSFLTTEEEYNVTRNLPSIIEIPDDSILDPAGKETITVMATKVDSIILELKVTLGILKSVDILRLAIITLVQHVHIAAETDTNLEDTVTVNLKFESLLTKDQIAVVKCLFAKEWNSDNDTKQLLDECSSISDEYLSTADVDEIESPPELDIYSQKDTSEVVQPESKPSCKYCDDKDKIIRTIEQKQNKSFGMYIRSLELENSRLKHVVEGLTVLISKLKDDAETSLVNPFQDDIGMISKTGKLGMKQSVSTSDDFSSLVSKHKYGLHKADSKLRDLSSKTIVDECRNCFEKDEIIIQLDRRLCEIRRRVIEAKNQSVSGNIVFEDLLQFIHHTTNMTSVEEKERMKYKELKSVMSSQKSELISDVDIRDPEKKANKKLMESQASQGRRPELDQTEEKSELNLRISEIRREYASSYYTKTDKQKGLGIIVQGGRSRYVPYNRDHDPTHLQEFFEEKGFIVKRTEEIDLSKLLKYMTDAQFYCVFIVILGHYEYGAYDDEFHIRHLLSQGKIGKPVIIMSDFHHPFYFIDENNENNDILIVKPTMQASIGLNRHLEYKNIFDDFMKVTRSNQFADIMDILTRMNALYDRPFITFQSSLRKKFCFL